MKKKDYINSVNKKHADILKEQMEEKDKKKKKGKMNVEELLQNKRILREIAEKDPDNAKLKKAEPQEVNRK